MLNVAMNIFCLLIIIGAHEYGHYYFARKYGVFIPNFSIGLGWELFGFTNKEGTRFSFRAIPLGGYVQFGNEGDINPLKLLTKWQRIKVYIGGPLANLLLCITASILLVTLGNLPGFEEKLPWYFEVLVATIGTIAIFIFAIPATVYFVFEIFISPVKSMEQISGPIGIITAEATETASLSGLGGGLTIELLVLIWSLSLAVGTFNLIPLSALDGGRIFSELFSKHKTFIKIWSWTTGVLLLVLIVYLLGTDIFKLISKD